MYVLYNGCARDGEGDRKVCLYGLEDGFVEVVEARGDALSS